MRYNGEVGRVLTNAKVAELVDALDLGSSAARRESSSLSFRTIHLKTSVLQSMRLPLQEAFIVWAAAFRIADFN